MFGRLQIAICLVLFLAEGIAPVSRAAPLEPAVLRSLREDASLHDAQFLSDQLGWVVGDRGVIWHTADGGRSWQLQESGVTCALRSVVFINESTGWAAGAEYHAYTPGSTGVLLHTRDGGATWQRDPGLMLPGLRCVKFLNARQGWALGESSSLFPSGLFTTDDGGRTWTAAPSGGVHTWSVGDFVSPSLGLAVGPHGSVAHVARSGIETSRVDALGLRHARCIKLASPQHTWLIGDGGALLHSADIGHTWQAVHHDTLAALPDELDLRALETRGSSLWIGGAPGGRVLMSSDHGATWQTSRTGYNLPINDIAFADEQKGWAVGALGMILHTADGGRTWRRQRNFSQRVAILGIFGEPTDIPLAAVAKLSGNDGYLSAVALVNRRDLAPGGLTHGMLEDRTAAALAACGAGPVDSAWRFPLRSPGIDRTPARWLALWDRVNEGQAMARCEAHLVREIRQWRPDVILTHAASLRGDDPLGHTINQLVLRAVEQAADAERYPELNTQLGLEPWRTRKVFGTLNDEKLGSVNLQTAQLAPRFGASLAEVAQVPRGWLDTAYQLPPNTLGFQALIDTTSTGTAQAEMFSGINLSRGSDGRRLLADVAESNVETMRRLAQKQRNLQAIVTQSARTHNDSARLLAELSQLTTGLDPRSAGDVLFQLAQHFAERGQWQAAIDTLQLFASHHAQHDLARPALTTLLLTQTSSEVGWQLRRETAAIRDPNVNVARATQALPIGRQLEHQHPLWFVEPQVQFAQANALRQSGAPRDAEKLFHDLVRHRPDDAWRSTALGELALLTPQSTSLPKSQVTVVRAVAKPLLDGQLDDEVWSQARPLEVRSATDDDTAWPAVGLLAYDDEYLYLAASCRRVRPGAPPERNTPRPRDPVLLDQDRVEWLFDVDRDQGTYYKLTIDERGWAADACWLDTSWNPQWFIAAGGDERVWTIEAAIPWRELVEQPPVSRSAWSVQLHRIATDTGFQSWSTPASTKVLPEGFGYALFE